ncbi:hypothetical protein [Bradyrhizobium erythrophlei]|jgi:hypothetical protein|uniref:Uncharacterized protein n=1 Tax=Bradyrhizobium erythrophlei TaxID=1437360 RepID=A0A1M5XZ96_9BRAD|nr:hypothetical protein [Bradyrhizobium erythrophlei]SHI05120.1 hypothetical protein SAMN05443248_7758 [Bradyrhizobium erythrophlei]
MKFLILLAIAIGAVALDYKTGPIFPDGFYCLGGAGIEDSRPASAHQKQSTSNGVHDWEFTEASTYCLQGTLWGAWSKKLGLVKTTSDR